MFKRQLVGIVASRELAGVSNSPHHLCRFVPLGRSSSDHWCFSCCLPGGEWRKGPNGNIGHGDDRGRHGESGHIFVCWNETFKWMDSFNCFLTGKNLLEKDKLYANLVIFRGRCKSAIVPMVQWKVLVTSKTVWDDQSQPSEKGCPSWPKGIHSKKVALVQKSSAKTSTTWGWRDRRISSPPYLHQQEVTQRLLQHGQLLSRAKPPEGTTGATTLAIAPRCHQLRRLKYFDKASSCVVWEVQLLLVVFRRCW